jgi:hypothetical protein
VSKEDFENEADTGTAELKSNRQRAQQLVDDILARPLTDDQATELAKVYATLAAVDMQERTVAAVEAIREPLGRFLAYVGLSGGLSAPEGVSEDDEDPSAKDPQ